MLQMTSAHLQRMIKRQANFVLPEIKRRLYIVGGKSDIDTRLGKFHLFLSFRERVSVPTENYVRQYWLCRPLRTGTEMIRPNRRRRHCTRTWLRSIAGRSPISRDSSGRLLDPRRGGACAGRSLRRGRSIA